MNELPAQAASVLILRDRPKFEVLMIERHAASAFAGGALVFPGGRVDPGDRDPRWADHAQGLDPVIGASQVAAIREAFEEAGVLIARRRDGALVGGAESKARRPWRARVEADDQQFFNLIGAQGYVLACDHLSPFSHWVAPPGLHRRFDTLFFAARLPEGQEAEEDGDEATASMWIGPADALAARARGENKIIFPTARNLDLLAMSRSADEVFAFAARRRIEPVQPTVEMRDGKTYLRIPEGLGFPVTSEELDPALRG